MLVFILIKFCFIIRKSNRITSVLIIKQDGGHRSGEAASFLNCPDGINTDAGVRWIGFEVRCMSYKMCDSVELT